MDGKVIFPSVTSRLSGGIPCGLSLWAQQQQAQKADLVLIHGHILTEDATDSAAQALAIQGQRIVAVGKDAAIMALAGPATQVIDLQGRTATTGLELCARADQSRKTVPAPV